MSNQNVRIQAANKGRRLSGGLDPKTDYPAVEFGANRVIVLEEFMFLPAYGVLWLAGIGGYAIVVFGLQLADLGTSTYGWTRLKRRGFFQHVARPSRSLARQLGGYGMRAQVGGIITQLNLRLDFVILTLLTGPAVLGVYAIASKFAELVKIVGMALSLGPLTVMLKGCSRCCWSL